MLKSYIIVGNLLDTWVSTRTEVLVVDLEDSIMLNTAMLEIGEGQVMAFNTLINPK